MQLIINIVIISIGLVMAFALGYFYHQAVCCYTMCQLYDYLSEHSSSYSIEFKKGIYFTDKWLDKYM